MSKKEKESTVDAAIKNTENEDNLEVLHEQKWFHQTGRDEKGWTNDHSPVSERESIKIYQDIGYEMFARLTEDVLSGKLENCRNGEDVFMHLIHLTDSEFMCCDTDKKTFNEYVDHRLNFCKKIRTTGNDKIRSGKHEDEYDLTNFTSKILKCKFKEQEYEKIEPVVVQNSVDKKHLRCAHKNCRKKFKSINGLKYHIKHGHRNPNDVVKSYKCDIPGCKKKYKNHNGLKYHYEHAHKESDEK